MDWDEIAVLAKMQDVERAKNEREAHGARQTLLVCGGAAAVTALCTWAGTLVGLANVVMIFGGGIAAWGLGAWLVFRRRRIHAERRMRRAIEALRNRPWDK